MYRNHIKSAISILLAGLCSFSSCKNYLEIPLPAGQTTGEAAFANDGAATASVNNNFGYMAATNLFMGSESFGLRTGMYSDELTNITTVATHLAYYRNALDNTNGGAAWRTLYINIYAINRAIKAIEPSSLLRRNQLLGESYFARALDYFYLTNLYGEVPIAITDDYRISNELSRAPQADVYKQIIADALKAKELLDSSYYITATFRKDPTNAQRARPNKFAASALLARAYLYTGDWKNAEIEASAVINNTAFYGMTPPESNFLLTSKELIWGLAPNASNNVIKDATLYYIAPGISPINVVGSIPGVLSQQLLNAFEPGDARYTNWVSSSTSSAGTFYFASKYKARTISTTATEYLAMFRLAEMYLIRAEARAKQGVLTGANGAIADIDVVRARAGLTGTPATGDVAVLAAIAQERRVELFTEQGHRLFDLRRTGKLDEVMNAIAASKGATWNTKKQWWPIMATEILANPKLVQTDGYQQ